MVRQEIKNISQGLPDVKKTFSIDCSKNCFPNKNLAGGLVGYLQ